MNDLETLQSLLIAAGLPEDAQHFQNGSLDWSHEPISEASQILATLRELGSNGAVGWILFADRVVEIHGAWSAEWDNDYPLQAELTVGEKSYRLTHLDGHWVLSTAAVNPDGHGLVETVSHRRLHGGMITHQVAWTGDPLRPTSAALTAIQSTH